MARFPFGGTAADLGVTVSAGSALLATPNTYLRFWTARSGGTEHTDFLDESSAAIAPGAWRTETNGEFPYFFAPDTVQAMWVDNASGTLGAMTPPKRIRVFAHQDAVFASLGAVIAFSGGTVWTATTAFAVGRIFIKADGSKRIVSTPYTTGSAYNTGATDDANSVEISPPPPAFTQTVTDALYAPISLAFGGATTYVGDTLFDGFDPDPNGFEVDGSYTLTSLLGQMDDVAVGGATQVMTYRFRSGSGYLAIGLTTIPDSKVSAAAPLTLGANALAATTTNANPVVTCATITTALQGQPVSGTNIPANSFVGTVIASTSFRISSSPTAQVDVNATASGSITANVAPTVAVVNHDVIVNYLINAVDPSSTTFPGAGLKIRIKAGAATFSIPTAPSTPTSFVLASSTSTSATFTWTIGTNSGETEVWKNKGDGLGWLRKARLFAQATWTDTDVLSGVSADYKILGRVPGAVSAFTSVVTVSPNTVWALLPQGGTLPAVPVSTFYTETRGTNTISTAAQISVSGSDQILNIVSGGTGSTTTLNDPQDRVILKAVTDTTQRHSWGFRTLLSPTNASAILEAYFGTDDFTLTTGSANFARVSILPNGSSCEGKAASYVPGAEGTGATGSFQKFTDSAYPTNIVTGATRASGGTIGGNNMTVGTYYGLKIIADVISGGRQLITIYWGTSAQYGTDGSSLPTLYSVNLTANFVTARPAGFFYLQELGKQTSPTAPVGWNFKNYHDILPIAV